MNKRIGRQVKVTLPEDAIAEVDRQARVDGVDRSALLRQVIMERFPVYVITECSIDLTDM